MKFTQSQQQFIDIANERIKRFQLDLVNVKDWGGGISTVLRHIHKNFNADRTRHLWLTGRTAWDIVIALMRVAGRETYGYGYLDTLTRALRKLHEGHRPLCMWVDEARLIRPIDREMLVMLCEHISTNDDIPIRLVLIVGKCRTWDNEAQKKINTIAHPERLLTRVEDGRARMFDFTREKMEVREDADDASLFAVKTA
jgi:hypothetical protein